MERYKHFVIIRFNIRAKFGCKVKQPQNNPMERILDEGYLEERFTLFETYTLPSLKNQTNQNFQVIVLFHQNTPEKFKKRITQMRQEYPFCAMYFSDKEGFDFEKFVSEYVEGDYQYFITSRLDNDDMYAETYIEKIQNFVNEQPEMRTCILSFSRGEKFDLREGRRYEFDYKQNHFLSMLAPAWLNIMKFDHSAIEKSGREIVVLEPNRVMWTEVIHESNVANKIQPYIKYQHTIIQLEHMNTERKLIEAPYIAIYGVGNVGKAVYQKIKETHRVICFIDEYADIREYDGIPIFRISDLSLIREKYGILLAVSYDQKNIADNLIKQLGREIEIKDIYDM